MNRTFFIFILNIMYLVCISQTELSNTHYNKALANALDSILTDDQTYRMKLEEIQKERDFNSDEVQAVWNIIRKKDEANLIKVTSILDQYGWLGIDVVGENGSNALFLVIQHSDLDTQEKYLPMMREAVKNGKAYGRDLALLEDRVAIRQGKKQIYGSQLEGVFGKYKFSPIEDEINVNKRRADVGLEPIEDYAKNFGIVYKMEVQNSSENNSFWSKYSVVFSLFIVVLLFSIILFLLDKFKQFAWFWLLFLFFILELVMLVVDYYSSFSMIKHYGGNSILFISSKLAIYCIVIYLINFITCKLLILKHILLDITSLFCAAFLYSFILITPLQQIILPDSGLVFRFIIFEPVVYSVAYLIICFILLKISYKRKKKELMKSANEDILV